MSVTYNKNGHRVVKKTYSWYSVDSYNEDGNKSIAITNIWSGLNLTNLFEILKADMLN